MCGRIDQRPLNDTGRCTGLLILDFSPLLLQLRIYYEKRKTVKYNE